MTNNPKTTTAKPNAFLLGEVSDQFDSDLKYRNDVCQCSVCDKYILKASFLMHELHCTKVNRTMVDASLQTSKSSSNDKSSLAQAKTLTKNDRLKKNPILQAQTDDFDELLGMFTQSNNVCCFKGCKVLVKTLGQNCEFCRNRFCLKHSLAEVCKC